MDHVDCSTYEVISVSLCKAKNGKFGCGLDNFKSFNTNRGVLSGPPILYFIVDQKKEGKYWVKTMTALLSEIFHPRSPLVNFGKEDTEECE